MSDLEKYCISLRNINQKFVYCIDPKDNAQLVRTLNSAMIVAFDENGKLLELVN